MNCSELVSEEIGVILHVERQIENEAFVFGFQCRLGICFPGLTLFAVIDVHTVLDVLRNLSAGYIHSNSVNLVFSLLRVFVLVL